MTYTLEINNRVDKNFKKLEKRDKKQIRIIRKKLLQVLEDPYRFKPLQNDMYGLRRVHIGSFVLVYEIIEAEKTVLLLDYRHHDHIY
ncbi:MULTISPECIES: type II toxin-antitoxin system RelE/ParE family toxin [Methanobacterium]|jgi:YafQ family addiction module toxin component|uniref:Type II toxin-antitoxin system RelE/ParE family toxin n=1 Tax=Methanobacterium formicicum TaxID=2162 RepID=A0A090I7I6_METFO|nr:type II toxin-antitoxin system RelE/ParE family toxin [Methanobacterium formicicum]KUK72108.1 MAG: Uncharacterized protein XD90_1995 [Methanobacterium sp. 42_16]MBF4475912.1 type II toxin-antitoxin system RelE/ParE family toxin [Methanobacterium formicicum]MDG3547282.1 type II toxin-antitoxin system RelE/ParE family toxin [Methanobacterium formicicum]CEA14190.1 hypothetical protein DSM1535_1865 [Methanobacterium formicicum]CEL24770.1 hypothetical protein MB9_1132 [Methanobacterium formicicu